MDGQYTPGPEADRRSEPPDIVVVGAVARDVAVDDPRGWRLGGGVAFGALTAARLGLRTAALIGADQPAATAAELELLAEAGVELHLVRLERGPVFRNDERPTGRSQWSDGPADMIPPTSLPIGWAAARGWLLAPVAGELADDWAGVPSETAFVAVGWQGLLRELRRDAPVRRTDPIPGPLLERADLVGVSHDDVGASAEVADLAGCLGPRTTLILTQGDRGGLVVAWPDRLRRYPAIRADRIVDPVGAGDVFLAAMAAARIQPRLVGGRLKQGYDLLLAAAAASLVVEGVALAGVPTRVAVARRMGEAATRRQR